MFLEPFKTLNWAYQLHYYVCFRTRWRHPEFAQANRESSISNRLQEVCGNHEYHLLQHRVYPDHLRCLLSLKPDQSISAMINKLKSNSSREFCSEFGLAPPLWATGYLARSVGRVRIDAVKQYLANQAAHHGYSSRVSPPVFRYRSEQPAELRGAHAKFDLSHHMVFATHYRRGVFSSTLGRELVNYWLKVAEKQGFALDQATVLPDHAHLLVRLAPTHTVEECALSLMNNAQHWLGKHYQRALIEAEIGRLWQPSAYAGTSGRVTTAMVKAFLGSAGVS